MKVAKFGGTSLASAEQIEKVFNIVTADSDRRIVVVSAPGKRFPDDIKVTDLLIAYGEALSTGKDALANIKPILNRFEEIANNLKLPSVQVELFINQLNSALEKIEGTNNNLIERIKSLGEDFCAQLIAQYFQSRGVDASYVNPQDAGLLLANSSGYVQVLPEAYSKLKTLAERKDIVIFPGFFGYSTAGEIITFARGGSDITGSILAAAVNADIYENYTDVDSVFVVNPNIVENPLPIEELTFKEMRELSYAGFTVFNEEALMPAYLANIPVNIKNTNNPNAPGTKIVLERDDSINPVIGIASDSGFCSIFVSKYMMNKEIGFGRKLLKILEDENISYEHTPSGIDNLSLIIREKQLSRESEERIRDRVINELHVDDFSIRRDLSLVMIVGEGMRHTIGLASKATKAFATANVNIEMINQGSSEVSMMFGIKQTDEKKAIQALYNEFFLTD
jgi:aspartate kinase